MQVRYDKSNVFRYGNMQCMQCMDSIYVGEGNRLGRDPTGGNTCGTVCLQPIHCMCCIDHPLVDGAVPGGQVSSVHAASRKSLSSSSAAA